MKESSPSLRPCHRTGNCCRGRGSVYLTPVDTLRIAEHLEASVFDFLLKYTHRTPHGPVLRVQGGYDGDGSCIFLSTDCDCSVQSVKPQQCAAYPMWERLESDAVAFEHARSECGMIGHLSHDAFRQLYASSQVRTR